MIVAKARTKKTKKSAAKPRFANDYYETGAPHVIYEVDALGAGKAKYYLPDGRLAGCHPIRNFKVDQTYLILQCPYLDDEDQFIHYRQRSNDTHWLMLSYHRGQVIEAAVFDRSEVTAAPLAEFGADGAVIYIPFRTDCTKRLMPRNSNALFLDFEDSERGKELRQQLAQEHAEELAAAADPEEALTHMLIERFHCEQAAFTEAECNSLLHKQFKAFCDGEKERRAQGIKTTLRLFEDSVPAALSVK